MKKNVIICLALLVSTFGFSQSNSTEINDNIKLKNVSIEVTVDSAEEIKSTFTTKGIKDLLDETDENEVVTFKIICKYKNENDVIL